KRKVLSDTLSGKLSYALAGNPYVNSNVLAYWSQNNVTENTIGGNRFVARDIETVGINADNRSLFDLPSLNGGVTFTYGAEYHADKQRGADTCPIGQSGCILDGSGVPITIPSAGMATGQVPSARADYSGVFVQAEFKFFQPLAMPGEFTLIPGARFDTFS